MSWQMTAIATYLKLTRKPRYASAAAGAARLAQPKGPSAPPPALTRRCDITRTTVNAFDVYTLRYPQRYGSAPQSGSAPSPQRCLFNPKGLR